MTRPPEEKAEHLRRPPRRLQVQNGQKLQPLTLLNGAMLVPFVCLTNASRLPGCHAARSGPARSRSARSVLLLRCQLQTAAHRIEPEVFQATGMAADPLLHIVVKLQGTEELLCYTNATTLAAQVFRMCKVRAKCQQGTLQNVTGMDLAEDDTELLAGIYFFTPAESPGTTQTLADHSRAIMDTFSAVGAVQEALTLSSR
ncbi:hypothetical protein WJX77_000354 [Trebouxia sp. C0004]